MQLSIWMRCKKSLIGNGWFVHSSGAGVTLQPLQGWYTTTFAWARRPLTEAGLTT